ncbi:hypothetical protein D5R40_33865, partial [Okeania hirsuta]
LDLAAVTAIQLDMLKQLANLHELDYSETSGKALVGALTGNMMIRIGSSLFKAIPGIGTVLGGISQWYSPVQLHMHWEMFSIAMHQKRRKLPGPGYGSTEKVLRRALRGRQEKSRRMERGDGK